VENKRGRIRRVKHLQITLAIVAGLSASIALADDFKTIVAKNTKPSPLAALNLTALCSKPNRESQGLFR
jgi:hypothetical protein